MRKPQFYKKLYNADPRVLGVLLLVGAIVFCVCHYVAHQHKTARLDKKEEEKKK